MADKKITALTDIGTGIGATDIWMVVDGIGGIPTNKKMTVSKFTGYFPSYLGFSQAPDAITSASTVVDVTSAVTFLSAIFFSYKPFRECYSRYTRSVLDHVKFLLR